MSVKATPDCSCGLPLGEWVGAEGRVVLYCTHCDELCPIPRDSCVQCERLHKTDNHNTSHSGKMVKIKDNGEGMPPLKAPKAIEPPKPESPEEGSK